MGPHQTVSQTPNQLELKSKAIEIKSKEKTLDRLQGITHSRFHAFQELAHDALHATPNQLDYLGRSNTNWR